MNAGTVTPGIHPHDAANWDAAAEENVRRLARHPKCVGDPVTLLTFAFAPNAVCSSCSLIWFGIRAHSLDLFVIY